MTLIVQDDAGAVLDADAYITVAYLESYADARNLTLGDVDEEAAIRLATEYVDTVRRYRGARLSGAQLREFPRAGCTDWSDVATVGVPIRAKLAVAYLAVQVSNGVVLWADLDRGGAVVSESIGPISTTYAQGASPHVLFSTEQALLAQYAYDQDNPEIVPLSCADDDCSGQGGAFYLGMGENRQE